MSILHQFKGPGGGFGRQSYLRARAAGLNPKQIAAAIGPSGLNLGWRARDAIIADTAAQAEGLKQQRNQARSDNNNYQNEISNYQKQISDFQTQIGNFQSQVGELQNKYDSQLKATQAAEDRASDFESRFTQKSAEYDTARAEADRYKDEAVGQQLRAIRSGATTSSRQDAGGGIGDLSGGRTRMSSQTESDSQDLADRIKSEGGFTESILNRKGPVVDRMATSQRRQAAPESRPNAGLSSGSGTAGYYATRFG